MTPYHYAIVQVRDGAVASERRNVGIVVLSPTLRKAWVRRADIKQRAHLIGDEAAFVRALLTRLGEQADEVARKGSAAVAHAWLRSRSLPTEDSLTLAEPAVGITEDIEAEVDRLRGLYLGSAGRGGASVAEKARAAVLRSLGVVASPRAFESGPATWKFPAVVGFGAHAVVIHALQFTQKKPEGVLDAAFHNIGRAREVCEWHPGVEWLTIAAGPTSGATGAAFERAGALMTHAGLRVVAPDEGQVRATLLAVPGWGQARVGEA